MEAEIIPLNPERPEVLQSLVLARRSFDQSTQLTMRPRDYDAAGRHLYVVACQSGALDQIVAAVKLLGVQRSSVWECNVAGIEARYNGNSGSLEIQAGGECVCNDSDPANIVFRVGPDVAWPRTLLEAASEKAQRDAQAAEIEALRRARLAKDAALRKFNEAL